MPSPNNPENNDEIQEIEKPAASKPKNDKEERDPSALSQVMGLLAENRHKGSERATKGPMILLIATMIFILAGIAFFYYITFVNPVPDEAFVVLK